MPGLIGCVLVSGVEPTRFIGFLLPTKRAGTANAGEALAPGTGVHFTATLRGISFQRGLLSFQVLQESWEMSEKHLFSFEVREEQRLRSAVNRLCNGDGTRHGSATDLVSEAPRQVSCEWHPMESSQRWGYIPPSLHTVPSRPTMRPHPLWVGTVAVVKGDETEGYTLFLL